MHINRIIIVGNGFDIAHGLATSYTDFINNYWQKLSEKICNYTNNQFPKEFSDEFTSIVINRPFISPEITKVNSLERLQDYAYNSNGAIELPHIKSNFFKLINNHHENYGWVDIEDIYKECLIQTIDISACKQLNKDLEVICDKLQTYLSSLSSTKSAVLHEQYMEFINSPILSKDVAPKQQHLIEDKCLHPKEILILNFNFTTTCEYYTNNCNINYIHGKLGDVNNPIIFGYGDDSDVNLNKFILSRDNTYLEHIKPFRYLETDNYRKLLKFADDAPFQIFIMGHSCGASDRTLLNTLFEHKNCISIKPFYHKISGNKDNYSDIIYNIYRSFSIPALFREIVVNKTYCNPMPQLHDN